MATLLDFKIRIRLRLGELSAGTFGIEDYEDQSDVDEIKIACNEAQLAVCRDIFMQQWMPFRRLQESLTVYTGQTIYTLPKNCLQITSLYHKKADEPPLLLAPKILSKYREIDPDYEGNKASTSNYFQFYETSGQIGEILAEGTVTWTDEEYQFAADDVSLTQVRIGDLVNNITDGSQGVITSFGSGIATLGDRLYGGRSNRMQYGDEFIIQSREETRFALETWPRITITSPHLDTTEISRSHGRIIFESNEDDIIENINVKIKSLEFRDTNPLSDYTPQTRLLLYIRRIIDEETHEYENIDIIGWQNAKAGINELDIIDSEINKGLGSIQLKRGIRYDMFLVNGDTQTTLLIDWALEDVNFLKPPTDRLIINYTKRPADFIINASLCELYEELHELIIEKAVLTLMRKKMPNMINASILQHYNALVANGREFLMNLQPPDSQTIDTEQPGLSTHSPGYSDYYW